MFDSISFENFRSIRKLHVDLRPINVLFGPNGSGKSTFLQGLAFLTDSVQKGLKESLRIAGGSSNIRSFGLDRSAPTKLSLQYQGFRYERWTTWERDPDGKELLEKIQEGGNEIIFHSDGKGFMGEHFVDDSLTSVRWPGDRTLWESLFRENVPRRLGQDALIPLPSFFNQLVTARSFACRRLDIAALGERGSISSDSEDLNSSGGNLWSLLRNLREVLHTRKVYATIQGYLRAAFPAFDDFELRTIAQSVQCNVAEVGREDPYPVAFAPDGLVHLASCLATLFFHRHDSATIVLDEPDLSLHPWALTVLADAIKEATSKWNRQVIIATHSPTLLSEFKEDEILLMQNGENGVTATRVSEIQEDRDLLNEYDLGSLYRMNIIGKQGDEALYDDVETPR